MMNQTTRGREGVRAKSAYDDLCGPALDPRLWRIARVRDQTGEWHSYQDRNAEVEVGGGRVRITVAPFTRFHDTDPVRNNAKQLYLSTAKIGTPPGREVVFDIDMAVRTFGQIPFDLLDAYGTANLVDFDTGTVINVAATNDTVFAVHERLARPGTNGRFLHRVVLDVDTGPGREHRYSVGYRSDTREVTWYVDGRLAYRAITPARVRGFHIGMGLFSSRSLTRFSRAEREHGQGATGLWGPWYIS